MNLTELARTNLETLNACDECDGTGFAGIGELCPCCRGARTVVASCPRCGERAALIVHSKPGYMSVFLCFDCGHSWLSGRVQLDRPWEQAEQPV